MDVVSLKESLDPFKNILEAVIKGVESLDQVEAVEKRVEEATSRLAGLTKMVQDKSAELDKLNEQIADHQNVRDREFAAIDADFHAKVAERTKAAGDEAEGLTKNLDIIREAIANLGQKKNGLEADIATLNQQKANLTAEVLTLEGRKSAAQE